MIRPHFAIRTRFAAAVCFAVVVAGAASGSRAVAQSLRAEQAIDALRPLAKDDDPAVRISVLLALADLRDGHSIREALADAQLPAPLRDSLVDRLLESLSGALILQDALAAGPLPAETKAAVLARVAAKRDAVASGLFEEDFGADAPRPQRLADAASAEDILHLKSDAARGERLFTSGVPSPNGTVRCAACHAVSGVGGDIGPDLSVIGRKLDRAALLEAILAPSKSVAPAFAPYLLEMSAGPVYAGRLVEKLDREVVFRDIGGQTVRAPADQVLSLRAGRRSLMPDLRQSDEAAQDAADLVAYLASLCDNDQPATAFRILGPFDAGKMKLDKPLPPEATEQLIAAPELAAGYQGVDGAPLRWELAPTSIALGFRAVDAANYDAGRKLRSTDVAHYFFVVAESPAAQTVTMILGAGGGCKLWLNGQLSHFDEKGQELAYGAARFTTRFKAGRNVILVKVQTHRGSGGVSLSLRGREPLELKTE